MRLILTYRQTSPVSRTRQSNCNTWRSVSDTVLSLKQIRSTFDGFWRTWSASFTTIIPKSRLVPGIYFIGSLDRRGNSSAILRRPSFRLLLICYRSKQSCRRRTPTVMICPLMTMTSLLLQSFRVNYICTKLSVVFAARQLFQWKAR